MSPKRILAITKRILTQLHHDRRTLALLFIVPSLLMVLLKFVFQDQPVVFNGLAPILLGIFPMIMMFLITSIGTLRERNTGTLDRLMTMSLSKLDFILGYGLAFSLVALVQAVITATVMLGLLDVNVMGGTLPTLLGAVAAGLLGTAMGLFTSAFAKTEFQAVQFMPAFIFPQLLVCGLFVAREEMAEPLQWFSNIVPLTYIVDFMKQIINQSVWTSDMTRDLIIIGAFTASSLILASITIRRQEVT